MMTVKSYIAPSGIQGNGLYAAEPIKKGQVIWKFVPPFDSEITLEEVKKLPQIAQDYIERYGYDHHDKPGVLILDGDSGRYMNHSFTPNTDFKVPELGVALVDIAEGEELTCNYSDFKSETEFKEY